MRRCLPTDPRLSYRSSAGRCRSSGHDGGRLPRHNRLYATERGSRPLIGVARIVFPVDAAAQQEAEPVIVEVGESVADALDLFD
jgi:hypothetical protein